MTEVHISSTIEMIFVVLEYIAAKLFCIALFASERLHGRELYWISASDGGLSTHFIQMKIMHAIATHTNRELVLFPLASKHYSVEVSVCLIYDLPETIRCQTELPGDIKSECTDDPNILDSENGTICFTGALRHLFGSTASRETIVRSVNLPLRMTFSTNYRLLSSEFMQDLGLSNNMYTAIHWRRGDQSARCKAGLDKSVNCNSVDAFVEEVRSIAIDKLIYIATDERNEKVLQRLKEEGFLLFGDANIISSTGNAVVDPDVDSVVLDMLIMLKANTFLGWGMSGVNDLVENERMLNNYTCCHSAFGIENRELNWCGLYTGKLVSSIDKRPHSLHRYLLNTSSNNV